MTFEPVREVHAEELRRIIRTPQVWDRWGEDDFDAEWPLDDADEVRFAILVSGKVVGFIQYGEEPDPKYRHASIDIFLDPAVHGRGLCRDAVKALTEHLIRVRRHRRLVIDPAADNVPAIRCYASVGFRIVGRMRQYERDASGGGWHDGLLMELLADDVGLRLPDAT